MSKSGRGWSGEGMGELLGRALNLWDCEGRGSGEEGRDLNIGFCGFYRRECLNLPSDVIYSPVAAACLAEAGQAEQLVRWVIFHFCE